MYFKDVIDLLGVTYTVNDIGDPIEVKTPRQVFANKKSIRQNEFYQSAAAGLSPEIMFEILSIEYQDEGQLSHNNKVYNIIRSFDKGEKTELICQGMVIHNATS